MLISCKIEECYLLRYWELMHFMNLGPFINETKIQAGRGKGALSISFVSALVRSTVPKAI